MRFVPLKCKSRTVKQKNCLTNALEISGDSWVSSCVFIDHRKNPGKFLDVENNITIDDIATYTKYILPLSNISYLYLIACSLLRLTLKQQIENRRLLLRTLDPTNPAGIQNIVIISADYRLLLAWLYRLQQATVEHSSAILAYAPDAQNWTWIGRGPDGGNCGTNIPWVQKTYQHSGRAVLIADWPRHNIRSKRTIAVPGVRPPANNNN